MGRGLGPFQREVLQRIGKHMEMFGDAKVGDIAKEMALTRGLVALVVDGMGTEQKLDVAHAIGLRRALSVLERRGLITCYVGGRVELTGVGAAMVGDCTPIKEEIAADHSTATDAFKRRRKAAIGAGRPKPNGARWD
jgi:hypothetical protein